METQSNEPTVPSEPTAQRRKEVAQGMARLEKQFMTPSVWQGSAWSIDTKFEGIVTVDASVMSGAELAREYPPNTRTVPGSEPELQEGWYAQLSASGYMDQTDLAGPFASEFEAETYLVDTYDDDNGDDDNDDDDNGYDDSPSQGDYVIRSDGNKLHVGIVEGKFVGVYLTDAQAARAVREHRLATSPEFWPNVWSESDHGNVSLYSEGGFDWTIPPVWILESADMVEDIEDGEDDSYTLHCYCKDDAQAETIRADLQSICGSRLERTDTLLYCIVSDYREVIKELDESGYRCEDRS